MTVFLLVFLRMSAFVFFSPLYGRRTLPMLLKTAVALVLTVTVYSLLPETDYVVNNFLIFAVVAIKELLIGFTIGYLMNLFFSTVIIGGQIIDLKMGLSMSKAYDPQSNTSIAVGTGFLNTMLMLAFFAVNGHLLLMRIFFVSFELVPVGTVVFTSEMFLMCVKLFSLVLALSVKLALPIIAAELIAEMGVGVIMRTIPQINIFAINLQLKVLVGIIVLALITPTMTTAMEGIFQLMFENMQAIFTHLG